MEDWVHKERSQVGVSTADIRVIYGSPRVDPGLIQGKVPAFGFF